MLVIGSHGAVDSLKPGSHVGVYKQKRQPARTHFIVSLPLPPGAPCLDKAIYCMMVFFPFYYPVTTSSWLFGICLITLLQ